MGRARKREKKRESTVYGPHTLASPSEFLVVQVEIIGGGDGEDVVLGMPGGMEDFFVKVEAIDGNLVLFPLVRHADLARFQDLPRTNVFPRSLEGRLPLGSATIEHPKEVVVTPRHYLGVVAFPSALELVENTASKRGKICQYKAFHGFLDYRPSLSQQSKELSEFAIRYVSWCNLTCHFHRGNITCYEGIRGLDRSRQAEGE